MAPKVSKTVVWAAEIIDEPGGLAEALTALAQAGANLEFIISRRQAEEPGTGVVFVTPLKGRKVLEVAEAAGFVATSRIVTLKVEGEDEPGIGARIAGTVAAAGINLRGLSAAVINGRFSCYLAFDSNDDAARTSAAIREEFRREL
jgi:hypothetical protein